MLIKIIAIGDNMPDWVDAGFAEYAKRLPTDYRLELIEIPSRKRTKSHVVEQTLQYESEKLLAAANHPIIALDRQGESLNTAQLVKSLQTWHDTSQNPCLLIGGPEGLAPDCLKRADRIWSLSALTFPHALTRVILAEQIYRTWSIIHRHPYHR